MRKPTDSFDAPTPSYRKMTIIERWDFIEQASPSQLEHLHAWFIGGHGAEFDQAAEHARTHGAPKEICEPVVEPVGPAEGELCPAWCTSAHLRGDRDHETDVHATVMSREQYDDDPEGEFPVRLMLSMYAAPSEAVLVGVSLGDEQGAELTLGEAEWLSERLGALIDAARTNAAPQTHGQSSR